MKKLLVVLFLLAGAFAVPAQTLVSNQKSVNPFNPANALFAWTLTTADFGKIKVGYAVTQEFTFINKGDAELVISSVKASCGCTVTEYSKDPISPGASGFVKATYNAAHVGVFTKTVTVNANTQEGVVVLTLKGEVVE